MKEDYYKSLGVARDADAATIKKAYRKLAVQFHPDRNKSKDAEEKFKKIGEAYEILSNPEKRAAYDRYGHEAFAAGGRGAATSHDPFDLFREVFGRARSQGSGGMGGFGDFFEGMFGGGGAMGSDSRREMANAGDDIRYAIKIGLEEVAKR